MIQLHIQKQEQLNTLISFREGEAKLGESLQLCDSLDQIKDCSAHFVIFGICEDIGVQANYGNPGTHKAWKAFLRSFVNVQQNAYNIPSDILLLGHITVTPDTSPGQVSKQELGAIVSRIDRTVAQIVETIISAGKIPIIIGGGHNNALGNLQGAATALKKQINVINIDAHTDLRTTDYRHSGNGFRYALAHKPKPSLRNYTVFGLHKNYTPQYIFDFMHTHSEQLQYELFEDLMAADILKKFNNHLDFVSTAPFGLELDCDAITNFSSSAQTPSGFALNEVRSLITATAKRALCCYFHICEAVPTKKNRNQIGKALSYFVTDFMREHREYRTLL